MLRFLLEKRNAETLPEGALWCPKDSASEMPGRSDRPAQLEMQDQPGQLEMPGQPNQLDQPAQPRRSDPPASGDCLAAVCWHGLYCSDATPDEEKVTAYFPFTSEGLDLAQKWLNGERRAEAESGM